MQKSVKKAGFHSIGATIRTRQELVSPVCGIFVLEDIGRQAGHLPADFARFSPKLDRAQLKE